MNWVYRFDERRFDERALKELKKLGHQAQRDILAYLDEWVAGNADPRRFGKGLKADQAGPLGGGSNISHSFSLKSLL